jgi:hypothetical protein
MYQIFISLPKISGNLSPKKLVDIEIYSQFLLSIIKNNSKQKNILINFLSTIKDIEKVYALFQYLYDIEKSLYLDFLCADKKREFQLIPDYVISKIENREFQTNANENYIFLTSEILNFSRSANSETEKKFFKMILEKYSYQIF